VSTQPRQDGVSIAEAAKLLGIGEDGVRKRIKRGLLHGYKADNKWFVVLDGQDSTRQDMPRLGLGSNAKLVSRLEDEIAFLRHQFQEQLTRKDDEITRLHEEIGKLNVDIEAWREQVRYKDLLLARLEDRLIQLPSPKEPEPAEQGSEQVEPVAAQAVTNGNVLSRFWHWFIGQ
jgi:hypothetical protein